MAAAPPHWHILVERDWSAAAAPGILRRLFALKPADVVVQYPTQGYGWSIIPHFVAIAFTLARRGTVTFALHEFSSLSRKSQAALALASHVVGRVIFTTEAERDRARRHPLFSGSVPTSVVGIISNIPFGSASSSVERRPIDLAYFGHIRPNKGLEVFLDVMQALRARAPTASLAMIGEIPAGYEAFGAMVTRRCNEIGCAMMLGRDDEAAARLLRQVRLLYLPFPDGVSARRGSVLAALGNDALVATRIGDATPHALRPAVIACDGTLADVDVLLGALAMTDERAAEINAAGRRYIAATLPRDWAHVVALYAQALGHAAAAPC
ncbi:hypothetical protein KZ813_07875 [Sphingomonas sp. RHCKR7]|uniref:hypothetical protein n=1 Tax=Sphingomonas folli TaxID=2862497 RepID=UPI001CA48EB1|nr:hypothetical protein [Sphingomonas folli]MBW6526752.1 hypothetical protein [Sphingomonas folli]